MKELTPREAHAFLQANPNALLIDVRSEIEHHFVGHPPAARHIPWNDGPEWAVNPDFVSDTEKLAGDLKRPLLLLCRSGNRSEMAAQALITAGFTQVFNIVHGFEGDLDEHHHRNTLNGWRHDGLPWEQC